MQSQGETFYKDFKAQHDVARSIVLNDIKPICDAILNFISDIQSDNYDGDASAYLSAYNTFFDQFDATATYAVNLFGELKGEVSGLLSSGQLFYAEQSPSCISGEITDQCEQNINAIKCTEEAFLNGLPGLAEEAENLLDLLIGSAELLQSFVQKFANADAETAEETQVEANKAFIVIFDELHNVIHTWFVQFETLCTNVDSLLTDTITTYFNNSCSK